MKARTTSLSLLRLNTAWVDLSSGRVERPDETLHLTEQERRLLEYLVLNPGRTVSTDELLEHVWGYAAGVISRAPQIAMSRLRHKVDKREGRPEHIHTVWGEGYRYVPPGRGRGPERPQARAKANPPAPGSSAQLVLLHDVVADLTRRLVFSDGQTVELTSVEAALLGYLAERPGKVISREDLLRAVWGLHGNAHVRKLDTAVYRLRRKIEADPAHPRSLVTVRGAGYWLRLRRFDTSSGEPTLPTPRSTFFGRAKELAAIDTLVRDGRRLVSVLGAGGAGKSRLALRYARSVAADPRRFPGGVRHSDVSPASHAVDVAQALGAVLDVTFMASTAPRAAAAGTVGRVLVVIDGFDRHIAGAVDIIDALLDAMPELTVLVTSRGRLGLEGEQCVDIGVLSRDDASDLFADRTAASGAGASLGPSARAAVLSHLGGHALSIELAAAQLRVQGLQELIDTVSRRLPDLCAPQHSGSYDAVERTDGDAAAERHESVYACFRWSWDRLAAREQIALSRCSVFGGPFSIEAAHAVVGTEGETRSASDVLSALCDHGLVEVMAHHWLEGESRYELIAPVRACAARELEASRRGNEVKARFVTWLAGECEHLRFFARSNAELQPLVRMAADRANIETALRWAQAEDPAAGVRLMAAVDILFQRRGPGASWSRAVEQAWRQAGDELEPSAKAVLAVLRAEASVGVRHRDDVEEAAREAVAAAQAANTPAREARGRLVLAHVLRSRDEAELAIKLAEEVDDDAVAAQGWSICGALHADAGEEAEALRCHRRAEELVRSGDAIALLSARTTAVASLLRLGRRRQARAGADEVLRLARESGDRRAMSELSVRLAEDGLETGRFEETHRHLVAARAAAELLGDPTVSARVAVTAGGLALTKGELSVARSAFSEALKQLDELGSAAPLTRALSWSALVALAADRPAEARELADEAVGLGGDGLRGAEVVRAVAAAASPGAAEHGLPGTDAMSQLAAGVVAAYRAEHAARAGDAATAETALAYARGLLAESTSESATGVIGAGLRLCLTRSVARASGELLKALH